MQEKFLFQLTVEDAVDAIAKRVVQLQTQQPVNPQERESDEVPISIPEACKLLRISKPTLHSWMSKGQIPFHRKGRRVFLFKSEILASLQQSVSHNSRRRVR